MYTPHCSLLGRIDMALTNFDGCLYNGTHYVTIVINFDMFLFPACEHNCHYITLMDVYTALTIYTIVINFDIYLFPACEHICHYITLMDI